MILKLDNLGYIVWSKVMMSARLFSSPTASTTYNNGGSSFYKVLEEGNGRYFVCGYYNNNTLGKRMGVVIEIADNGLFAGSNSGTLYQFPGSSNTRIGNVAFDPTSSGQRVIIGGTTDVATSGGTEYHGFLSKVNPLTLIPTATNQQVIVGSIGTGNNGTGVATVLTQTNGSGFNVYISGSERVGGTTSAPTKNADNTNVTVNLPDNDILFMCYDGTNLTSTPFKKTYNKTDLTSYPIPSGEEVGPGSSRSASGTPLKIGGSEAAGLLAPSNNLNESGGSMIFTNTVPQKIAMVATVNAVGMRPGINGTQIFRNNSTLIDASRSGAVYDDYFDADAYLLKIDPSNGNLLTSTAYAGHFSGDDFNIKVVQNNQGDYVLGGSSSDYYSSSLDVITPHSTDGYLICLDGSNGTRKWRRTYHAQDIEDEFCVFGIAATADGGVALGGNNDNDADNFSVSKFAPPCPKLVSYSLSGVKTYTLGQNGVSTNVTWTSNNLSGNSLSGHANIKSHIIVPSGSTLTIDNCDLRFASSDHIYDYYMLKSPLPTGVSVSGTKIGIEVRPGGKLILKNGTILQGINDCNDHYMWDGVTVVGNPATSPQSATTQGSLTMSSGSMIKDARIGIEVSDAKRNYTPGAQYSVNTGNDLTNGLTNSSRYQENGSLGGGMLNLSYSTIKNCRFGIRWWDYNHPNNTGYIDRCNFINDDYMADICAYISADNRRYGAVSFINTGSLDKIQILSNNFSCDATKFLPDYRPWGILANETGLNISTDNPSVVCQHVQSLLPERAEILLPILELRLKQIILL